MSEAESRPVCPHCQQRLLPFAVPDGGGWDQQVHWACFNDDCPYYVDGWTWMWEQYRAKASYRYRVVDPHTGEATPLAVWSPTAIRNLIIEDPE
jgi:hypothetical protein